LCYAHTQREKEKKKRTKSPNNERENSEHENEKKDEEKKPPALVMCIIPVISREQETPRVTIPILTPLPDGSDANDRPG
jgi:hypothetical protein